jgi:hypothetical protein
MPVAQPGIDEPGDFVSLDGIDCMLALYLLVTGGLVGWYASQRFDRRRRRALEGKASSTASCSQPGGGAAAAEHGAVEQARTMPKE